MGGHVYSPPPSLIGAHIYIGFGKGGSWNSGWGPCLWNWKTQSLFELQITWEQAMLFPWNCKLQPPFAVHIKYQSRPPLRYIINQLGHGLSQTFPKWLQLLSLLTPWLLCHSLIVAQLMTLIDTLQMWIFLCRKAKQKWTNLEWSETAIYKWTFSCELILVAFPIQFLNWKYHREDGLWGGAILPIFVSLWYLWLYLSNYLKCFPPLTSF